jgi:5-methylcytosine-specific restriction endonuclease McrA
MFEYKQQLLLKGVKPLMTRKKYIRVASFSFDEGMYIINHIKQENLHGVKVDGITDPQSTRIRMIANGQISCVSCGLKGNHFYIERHENDTISKHSLNLYAIDRCGVEQMLTWDHIIPKSLGGSNLLDNAQCMCEKCNRAKGNYLSLTELIEIGGRKNALTMYASPIIGPKAKTRINDTLKMVRNDFKQLRKQGETV